MESSPFDGWNKFICFEDVCISRRFISLCRLDLMSLRNSHSYQKIIVYDPFISETSHPKRDCIFYCWYSLVECLCYPHGTAMKYRVSSPILFDDNFDL